MTADFSPQVRTKGERYVVTGRVSHHAENVWRVRGSGRRPYIVNADLRIREDGGADWSFVTCTCPHGSNVAAPSCSHWCAVLLFEILKARGQLGLVLEGQEALAAEDE